MDEPEHEGFVYQVVIEGTTVIVMADWEDAQRYIEKNMRGIPALILPVPVFKFGGDRR